MSILPPSGSMPAHGARCMPVMRASTITACSAWSVAVGVKRKSANAFVGFRDQSTHLRFSLTHRPDRHHVVARAVELAIIASRGRRVLRGVGGMRGRARIASTVARVRWSRLQVEHLVGRAGVAPLAASADLRACCRCRCRKLLLAAEEEVARHLVAGELLPAVLAQRRLGGLRVGDHEGGDVLAPLRVGPHRAPACTRGWRSSAASTSAGDTSRPRS